MTVHADDTREELAEFLRNQNARAKREFPKVGSAEQPTPWDKRHATINEMLTDYFGRPA